MYRKLLFLTIVIVGIFFAIAVFAQTCPHVYEGINCGANWYCNGCQTTCKSCPGGGDPTGATELNYVSCTCGCPSGQIVCSNACVTAPACSTPTREQNNSSCNGCGACKSGYAADPSNPNPPSPCLKAAYIDYPNTGYFQTSGDLKSTGGDLYLASGKAIRIDGAGTTTLNIGNFTGTSLNTTLTGGLVVKGTMALTSMGAGTVNAEKFCIAGDCRDVWPAAVSAFVQNGNTFGALAVLGTNDSWDLAIRTAGAEKMRLTTGGNFGVGTTSPAYKLDVAGQANATQLCIAGTCRGSWPAPVGSDGWVQFYDGGNFGGSSGFIYNKTSYSLLLAGAMGVNGLGDSPTIGIKSRGSSAGGYFQDTDNSGYAYVGWGNYGIYSYGSLYGVYGLGGSQGVYGNGTDYGIYGTSNNIGVYGLGTYYGVYGATSSAAYYGGFFSNSSTSTYAGLAYSTWAGYFGGNVNITGNLTVGSGSPSDDDYIYFDDGTKYMKWENMMSRYYFDSGVFSAGQVSGSNVNAYSGGTVQTTDSSNQRAIAISHNGTDGLLETSSASPGINAGNLILRGDIDYPANFVDINDDLRVTGGIRTTALANKGAGSINAEQLCLWGDCKSSWPSGGTPGGGDKQVQFNNSGLFAGDADFTYNSVTNELGIASGGIVNAAGGVMAGGFAIDTNYGVKAKGSGAGGFFQDSTDSGYAYLGWGNYGAAAYGNEMGGFFQDTNDLTYGYIGWGSYGGYFGGNVYASGYITANGNLSTSGTLTVGSLNGILKALSGIVSVGATTSDLPEGANQYFTTTKARTAITKTAPITYDAGSGNIGLSTPLAVSYGGTGITTTPSAGSVVYGNGTNYTFTAVGSAGQFLQSNGTGAPGWANGISGSGTANYLAKFTAGTTISNSVIYDNGTNVGIGTTAPGALFDVQGAAQFGSGNVNLIDSTGRITGISSTYFASVDGSALTGLNASNLASGIVPSARLSGSYAGITGLGTLSSGITVGSDGNIMNSILHGSITVDPPSIAANSSTTMDVTITGASGKVFLTPASGFSSSGIIYAGANVPAANTVRIGFRNTNTVTIDMGASTWVYLIIK